MDVILPKWGMTMQEATVTGWLKAVGDPVDKGDELVEVETDKVSTAVEAPTSGVLTERRAEVGDVVAVGDVIAVIDESA